MPLLISVMQSGAMGNMLPRRVIQYVNLTAGASTTALGAGQSNLTVKLLNTEATPGRVAWGSAPNATLAAPSAVSTAAMVIGVGEVEYIHLEGGELINFVATV